MRRSPESRSGTLGWAAIGAFVLAWDFTQKESLTHAFERARSHPVGRIAALGGLTVTAAHLAGVIPHQVDPFYRLIELHGERQVDSEA